MVDLGLLLNWLAVIILICVATIAVMSTASGAIALISWALRLGSLLWVPTPTGVRPIDRRAVTAAGTGLVDRAEQVAAIRASQPAPPHIVHYHAHTSGGQATATVSKSAEQQITAPMLKLPAPLTLSQALTWQPTLDRILVGINETGQPLTVPAGGLCHVGLAGTTGNGKSIIMRMLLSQLLAAGADVAIADPHYTSLDVDRDEDWRPIEQRLIDRPSVQISEISDLLSWTVEEIDRRLALRREGKPIGRPLFLAVDELPIIVSRLRAAPALLARVVREGRKVGVLAIVASQDFLVDTIGGSGGVRDCYRTAYYVGGDATTGRVMLDLDRGAKVPETTLGKGIVLLRSPATPVASLARVPLTTNADLRRLLPSSSHNIDHLPSLPSPSEVTLEGTWKEGRKEGRTTDDEIRERLTAGQSVHKIVVEVHGVSGGQQYKRLADQVRALRGDEADGAE